MVLSKKLPSFPLFHGLSLAHSLSLSLSLDIFSCLFLSTCRMGLVIYSFLPCLPLSFWPYFLSIPLVSFFFAYSLPLPLSLSLSLSSTLSVTSSAFSALITLSIPACLSPTFLPSFELSFFLTASHTVCPFTLFLVPSAWSRLLDRR